MSTTAAYYLLANRVVRRIYTGQSSAELDIESVENSHVSATSAPLNKEANSGNPKSKAMTSFTAAYTNTISHTIPFSFRMF